MDEEIEIINTSTKIDKIKNFFINNRKRLIYIIAIIIIVLFGYLFYSELEKKEKTELANRYNLAITKFTSGEKSNVVNELKDIIEEKNATYSPLALYFLMDNGLINSNEEINRYFDLILNETNLEEELINLIIFKKALFNSDFETEDKLLNIIKPLMNSDSVWKSHSLYLMAEYFFSKGEKQKSREFYDQIIKLENSNPNIKLEAQKRIRRDFSE